ncbi:MAG: ATP-dependent DNA helicase [Candidatus Lokiarchaeota archaeon]|nr:ATP-dependent DNA helicase [Candidatus Lokiarchaeota archaeon]
MKILQEQKEFHVSVKDVVVASSDRRSYTSAIPLRIRGSKGTEVHQTFQESRKKTEKSFQREVLVKLQTEVRGWSFIISGRADIIYEKKGTLIIEEIKSISNLEDFSLESQSAEEYRLQLLLYGHYFLQLQKTIQCRLVLIDIYTEKSKIIDVPPQDLSAYIEKQCGIILTSWEREQKLKAEQRNRAKTLVFPFEKYRPHQQEIVQMTFQSIQKRERLMVLAPSGLGKTVGTLYPALEYALKKNKRVFVITSKTTQQHIYRETLRIFSKKKAKFNSIILTAKEKMCINSAFICEKSVCPYLNNYEKVSIDKIVSEILTKQVIDARYIRKIAKTHTVCPFEISLDCSLHCDVIVGDYNYVFHPFIKLKRFFDQPYNDIILIVDEAHNLPFRAMTYYSPEITLKSLTDTTQYLQSLHIPKSIEKNGLTIYDQLTHYIMDLINQYPEAGIKKPVLVKFDKKFFREMTKNCDQFIISYVKSFTSQQGFQPGGKNKVIEFALNLRQFSTILKESDSPEYSELLYIKEGKIKLLCKSAAPKLEKQIKGFHSVIIQSATLFPMEYFQKMVGFPTSANKIQFNSPFSQQNRLYLLLPNYSTRYDDRQESYDQIARTICNAVNIRRGNYLAFFPSFAYLKAVQREIETKPLSIELIVQERKMSESKRRTYLKKMKNSDKNYLLLAVHGGIFSEGVDFIGDMAIGAFIIGPGLPSFSMEQELMKKYFEFKWKKGFEYAYRNPGMMKVIQAAGRIFRTTTDRGFVMLIGHRFSTRYYNSVLPDDWEIEQPVNLFKRLETFWMTQSSTPIEKKQGEQLAKKYPKTADLFDFMEKL